MPYDDSQYRVHRIRELDGTYASAQLGTTGAKTFSAVNRMDRISFFRSIKITKFGAIVKKIGIVGSKPVSHLTLKVRLMQGTNTVATAVCGTVADDYVAGVVVADNINVPIGTGLNMVYGFLADGTASTTVQTIITGMVEYEETL